MASTVFMNSGLRSFLFGNLCSSLTTRLSAAPLCRHCHTVAISSSQKRKLSRTYGQPTAVTHPHLMQDGQVTPGITQEEIRERRFKLMELVGKQCQKTGVNEKSHLLVIPSSSRVYMSDKIPYPFRQNTDFLYLTGFQEPDSILILHSLPQKELPEHNSVLFVPKKNSHTEMWEGPRTGTEGAVELLGVDKAYEMHELEKFLESFGSNHPRLLLWYDCLNSFASHVDDVMKSFIQNFHFSVFQSPRYLIHQLRVIKSDAEIKLMRQTTEIAADSLREVIKSSYPSVLESHLNAKMDYECRIRGADRLAYPPVVAGGSRSNTIHYTSNNQQIFDGEMVLMDAGCEYSGYSSDVTRTWPVNGRFSSFQKELYEAVLTIQEEIIELCGDFSSLDHLFHAMCQLVGAKLQELHIVPDSVGKIELSKIAYSYCPHHVGHYLGMDVHDTTLVQRSIKIKPGMVITIEPGIYIREDNTRVPARYRGLGVRVEDDVLITDVGPEVLTLHCPKTVEGIEKLFS